jgi:RimJ/RimL family protein N-acetyltransferase
VGGKVARGLSGPVLETARLRLRPPVPEDFEPWAAFMADEGASRFIGGPLPRTTARRGFMAMAGSWSLRGFGMFSVIEKASGRWIGRVGPLRPEGWPGPEIGWALVRDAWGQGFAEEAAAATMSRSFSAVGWLEVIHLSDPANEPTRRLASRLGSARRGMVRLPAPYSATDLEVWGQDRATRQARAGR